MHGVRGMVTSTTTAPSPSPIRQRSPISAPLTSMPLIRRFSPNRPAGTSRSSSADHQAASSSA